VDSDDLETANILRLEDDTRTAILIPDWPYFAFWGIVFLVSTMVITMVIRRLNIIIVLLEQLVR